jgi:hypothetical protein
MNTGWLKVKPERRIEILNLVSNKTGLPAIAIEKDWWVTLTLKACFALNFSKSLVFKGGTSLSKGWGLIERFSEDVDLAIDRNFFGYSGDISKSQIKNLRKQSCKFISTTFLESLSTQLSEWNVLSHCKLVAQPVVDSDKDPQIIEIHYNSLFSHSIYLPQRVLIEISSRSLIEPCTNKEINAILDDNFPGHEFSAVGFNVAAVLPQRTF